MPLHNREIKWAPIMAFNPTLSAQVGHFQTPDEKLLSDSRPCNLSRSWASVLEYSLVSKLEAWAQIHILTRQAWWPWVRYGYTEFTSGWNGNIHEIFWLCFSNRICMNCNISFSIVSSNKRHIDLWKRKHFYVYPLIVNVLLCLT